MLKIIIYLFCIVLLTACNNHSTQTDDHKKDSISTSSPRETKNANTQVTYQCPMKCEGEKTYSKIGKCSVCEMDLSAMN